MGLTANLSAGLAQSRPLPQLPGRSAKFFRTPIISQSIRRHSDDGVLISGV